MKDTDRPILPSVTVLFLAEVIWRDTNNVSFRSCSRGVDINDAWKQATGVGRSTHV